MSRAAASGGCGGLLMVTVTGGALAGNMTGALGPGSMDLLPRLSGLRGLLPRQGGAYSGGYLPLDQAIYLLLLFLGLAPKVNAELFPQSL